jgi:hypothetical protein
MTRHPLFNRLLCVAMVAALMMPIGRALFPYIGHEIGTLSFDTIEAVVTAALGYGVYGALFG